MSFVPTRADLVLEALTVNGWTIRSWTLDVLVLSRPKWDDFQFRFRSDTIVQRIELKVLARDTGLQPAHVAAAVRRERERFSRQRYRPYNAA